MTKASARQQVGERARLSVGEDCRWKKKWEAPSGKTDRAPTDLPGWMLEYLNVRRTSYQRTSYQEEDLVGSAMEARYERFLSHTGEIARNPGVLAKLLNRPATECE